MTLRLCVCFLILLMMTLISLQHPLPVLNSENSKLPDCVLAASQYQEREDRNHHVRHKRQAVEEVEGTENQNHNQNLDEDIEKKNNENDRKKRLETEERALERNQYYKPINEETREHSVADSSKQGKAGKLDQKMTSDLSSSAKINVASVKRPARQAAESGTMDPNTNNAWLFRSGNKIQEELNENSNVGNVVQTLSTGQRREREILEVEEAQYLRPDTLETIRKINPLTIGDQVAKMIHDRKCNTRNKLISPSSFGAGPVALQNEAHVVESGNCLPHDNYDAAKKQAASYKQEAQIVAQHLSKENNDCRKQASSSKQQGQRDVQNLPQENESATMKLAASDNKQAQTVDQKPCLSNDYGFSVIILAGDPLKVGGSGAGSESEGKESGIMKEKPKISDGDNTENQSRSMSKTNGKNTQGLFEPYAKKELRVPINHNAKVEFPIYDQDINFIPDPFNGLLDEKYWVDPLNKEDNIIVLGGVQSNPLHRIHVRGILNKNGVCNGTKFETCDTNGKGVANGAKSCVKFGNFTADSSCDLQGLEPFGDMNINLNNTSCLSYRVYDGNANNKTSKNYNKNNNKSVTYLNH